MANIESVAGSATPFRARAANRSSTQASAAIAATTTSFGRRVALAAAVASGTQTNAEAAEHNASRPRSRASAAGEYASPSSAGSNACFAKTSETCTQVASAGAPTTRGSRPIVSTAVLMQRFQLPCCLCSGFSCLRFQLPMAAAAALPTRCNQAIRCGRVAMKAAMRRYLGPQWRLPGLLSFWSLRLAVCKTLAKPAPASKRASKSKFSRLLASREGESAKWWVGRRRIRQSGGRGGRGLRGLRLVR